MTVYCLLVLTYKWKSSSLHQRKLLEHTESKQYLLYLSHSQPEKIFYQTKLCQLNTMLCTPVLGYTLLHFHLQFGRGFSSIFFSATRSNTCAKHVTCTIFGYSALKQAVGVVVSKYLLNSKKLYWQGKILNYNKNLKSNTNNDTAFRKSVKNAQNDLKLPKNDLSLRKLRKCRKKCPNELLLFNASFNDIRFHICKQCFNLHKKKMQNH